MTKNGYNILVRCLQERERLVKWHRVDGTYINLLESIQRLPVFEIPEGSTATLNRLGIDAEADYPPPFDRFIAVHGGRAAVVWDGTVAVAAGPSDEGRYLMITEDAAMRYGYQVSHAFKLTNHGKVGGDKSDDVMDDAEWMGKEVSALLSLPRSWAVEVSPANSAGNKVKFMPRIHERTRIQIWMDDKVHETFRASRPSGETVKASDEQFTLAAHRRRGHWKTLRSPRYINMQGKKVWTKAAWVGPREMVVGQNRYEVRLDL